MPIHIEAEEKDIAKIVLLPGDPKRAEYIAKNFLKDSFCYNDNRLMLGFTGRYNDKLISIQSTGMGAPAISIIIAELVMLKAKTLIRIGTCGSLNDSVTLKDLIIATGANSTHNLFREFNNSVLSAIPDFRLTYSLIEKAKEYNFNTHYGMVLSSEFFYENSLDLYKKFSEYNTLGVEMETYPLFVLGNKHKIKTASVLTVSDIVYTQKRASKKDIQNGVDNMIRLVLDLAVKEYPYLAED